MCWFDEMALSRACSVYINTSLLEAWERDNVEMASWVATTSSTKVFCDLDTVIPASAHAIGLTCHLYIDFSLMSDDLHIYIVAKLA